jgi:hypothetical protein
MTESKVGGLPPLPDIGPEGWYTRTDMIAYARAALSAHGENASVQTPVVDEAVIEAAWMEQCGAGWGLSWEEMLRKMFKSGTWGDQYSDGDTIYTHPEHGTELTAYMATLILATHGPFVQGYRAALGDTP